MNGIKNTIVFATLLAVGYGAYVVLNNPPSNNFGQENPELAFEDLDLPSVDTNVDEIVDTASEALDKTTKTVTNLADQTQKKTNGLLEKMQPPKFEAATDASDSMFDKPFFGSPNNADSTAGNVDATASNAELAAEANGPAYGALPTDTSASQDVGSYATSLAASQQNTSGDSTVDDAFASLPAPSDDRYSIDNFDSPANTDDDFYNRSSDASANANTIDSPSSESYATDVSASTDPNQNGAGVHSGTAMENREFEQKWTELEPVLARGRLHDVLKELSAWYNESTLTAQQRSRLLNKLDQLAGTVIYSPQSFLEPTLHTVRNGETLESIAKQYGVSTEFIARVNGVAPSYRPIAGETVKYVTGPFRAEVSVGRSDLTVYLGPYYAGRFSVKLGDEFPRQEATYEVFEKFDGQEYFDAKTGYRVPKGDSQNPYGDCWISLRGDQVTPGSKFGIHIDNGNLSGMGIAVSEDDADDLKAILTIGSPVAVRP